MSDTKQYRARIAGNLARPEGSPERFRLDSSETGNIKVLAARLRQLHVLPKGMALRSAVQIGHDWTVQPRAQVYPIVLERTDLWTHIGRGKAGWHAQRPDGTSSSGGTLEPLTGVYERYPEGVFGPMVKEPWSRPGYLAEAAEGTHVWDADGADYGKYASFVMSGPMLSASLRDDGHDAFGAKDREAAARMMGPGGLEDGFAVLAAQAIGEANRPEPPKYGSLDQVGWTIYRSLLEAIGGVRFGVVKAGRVVWES